MSAGNIKLNLKEFRHIASDKDKTILEHKRGHRLELAHKGLSPESRQQLQELAKGGNPKLEESKKVPPKPHYDEGGLIDQASNWYHKQAAAGTFGTGPQATEQAETLKSYTNNPQSRPATPKAEGGKVQYYNKGTGNTSSFGGSENNYNPPPPVKDVQSMPAAHPTDTSSSRTSEQAKAQQDAATKSQDASRSSWDPDYKPNMAEGGPTPDPMRPCLNPNCKSHGQHHPNCRCYGGMAQGGYVESHDNDNESAKEEYFCDMPRHHFKGCEYVMAKGGEISQQGQDIRHAMRDKQRGNSGAAQQQMEFAKSEAKGRAEFERSSVKPKMKGLADGGKPEDADNVEDMKNNERDFHHQYIEPDREESQDEQNKGMDKEIEDASNFANPDNQAAQAAPMAPEDQPQTQQSQAPQQSQAQAQAPQQPQDQSGYQNMPAPVDTQQQNGNYNPQQDLNPIQRFQNTVQNYDQTKQNLLQSHLNESDAWKQDLMNGHIEPLTYKGLFAKKSTPEKIGTLFGLLLSGAGSGLAHQPNMVLGMMNQEIQNDLQAQQHSKENALNYLRVAQAHEANKANIGQTNALANTSAIANSKARMDWSNFHQIVTDTQKMPEPTPKQAADKQRAMQALAYMNDEIQKGHVSMFDKLASAQAAAQVVGGGLSGQANQSEAAFQQRQKMLQSGMMGPKGQEISKMETARHLPGVAGAASRDVSSQDAEKFNGYKTLDNQLQDLKNAVNQYSNLRGNVDPKVIGPMAVKAHEAAALYNKTLDGLGMTEGRMGWLENQIPSDPQKFMERLKGSKEKLEEVANNNNMRKNTMLNNYGFPAQTQGVKPKPGYTVEQHNGKNYYVPIKKK